MLQVERTNVCLGQIRERIEAGAKLLEVAAIRIAYGLLLQAVDIEIAINFRNKLRELIGDFDGLVNETVEF